MRAVDTQALLQWARETDRVLPESIRERRQDAGAEHEVWFQDGRVFKAAVSPQTVGFAPDGSLTLVPETSVTAYLERIELQNGHFDDDIRLEAVVIGDDERVIPIISQPIVQGIQPTVEEIADYFHEHGFVAVAPHIKGWFSRGEKVMAADAHDGNLVVTKRGMAPFDLVMTTNQDVIAAAEALANRPTLIEVDDTEL